MDRSKLYTDLYTAYKKCFDNPAEAQKACTASWNSIKLEYKDIDLFNRKVKEHVVDLENKARKKTASRISFWCSVPVKSEVKSCSVSTQLFKWYMGFSINIHKKICISMRVGYNVHMFDRDAYYVHILESGSWSNQYDKRSKEDYYIIKYKILNLFRYE